MRFSQRIGKAPASKIAQRESMDEDLRNSLWSLLSLYYWDSYEPPETLSIYSRRSDLVRDSNLYPLVSSLWLHYFKKPIDTVDQFWEQCYKRLREYYFKGEWFEVYDFLEFVAENGPNEKRERFIQACNSYLVRENSAYRFVSGKITEITSKAEIDEVELAIEKANPFGGAKTHLQTALDLLSDRKNPDYRNSIKESISAVESVAKKLAKDQSGTLGSILKALEKSNGLHPALKNAFSSLYGYTSDSNGIRHALLEESNLSKPDAKFMLVCCSAFINFAIETIKTK